MIWIALFSLLVVPAVWVFIDGFAGIRSRAISHSYEPGTEVVDDFRILVPIWGSTEFLTHPAFLAQYGDRVTLCTTGDETPAFYSELERIAAQGRFSIFRDDPLLKDGPAYAQDDGKTYIQKDRATSGTVRDRLIRNVLDFVPESYVVLIDADTTMPDPVGRLVGELARNQYDVASVRLVPENPDATLLTRLQRFEYRLSMQVRFLLPWALSGACQVARTSVLRDVMSRHSLFFQGNDVETGIIANELGYRVGHIPFEVRTVVPSTLRGWLRQRLAWAGGEFRLYIVNSWLGIRHPFFWLYGAFIGIACVGFRWLAISSPTWPLVTTFALYLLLVLYLHWEARNPWMLLMPLYSLFLSLVMIPLGIFWYFKMVAKDDNWGIIRPHRHVRVTEPV